MNDGGGSVGARVAADAASVTFKRESADLDCDESRDDADSLPLCSGSCSGSPSWLGFLLPEAFLEVGMLKLV